MPRRSLVRNELGQKKCNHCGNWLAESEFSKSTSTVDGWSSRCRACLSGGRYGLNRNNIARLLDACGWKCPICGDGIGFDTRGLHIDHDHSCCPGNKSCGRCLRGVICGHCNKGLGYFRDSPQSLRAAIYYLERTASVG
ncbi:endonuclease VII [Mycobacterium phage Vetrix]|nr:endonuclease VII [Mycobacterium phage Vetrix]